MAIGQRRVTVIPARVLEDGPCNVTIAEQDLGVGRTIHAVTRKATTAAVSVLLDLLGMWEFIAAEFAEIVRFPRRHSGRRGTACGQQHRT